MMQGSEKVAYACHSDYGVLSAVHLDRQGLQRHTSQWQRRNTGHGKHEITHWEGKLVSTLSSLSSG